MAKHACPHPDCDHEINLAEELPAGIYVCPCQAIKVRLAWDSYLGAGRKPRLEREK